MWQNANAAEINAINCDGSNVSHGMLPDSCMMCCGRDVGFQDSCSSHVSLTDSLLFASVQDEITITFGTGKITGQCFTDSICATWMKNGTRKNTL